MKKILLLNPNTYDNPYKVFPLGLAYLDDSLQRAGHTTEWADLNLESVEELEARLRHGSFDFVAISLRNIDDVRINVREFFVESIRALIEQIRSVCEVPLILGGSGFSILPETIFNYCQPDFGIAGEGELALLQLVNGEDRTRIAGLLYRDGDRLVHNPLMRLSKTPEQPPLRNSKLLEYYLRDGGMANVQTQRGCPLKCCYCTYPLIEGKQYRRRSGASIAAEFKTLQQQGAKYVFIVDSVFNTSVEHVREICNALITAGTPLPWGCFMRPKHVSRELLELMKAAGLQHVEFGSDSLCDTVLKAYQKGFTFEDIHESSRLARDVGIDFCHFVIFGGPGETAETMTESFENSKRIAGALFFPAIGMRVYPDTRLHAVLDATHAGTEGPGLACQCEASHLLHPTYYLAPGLTIEALELRIAEFAAQSANWVNLEQSPEFDAIAKRLRKKGVAGPLWNYLSVMRRLA